MDDDHFNVPLVVYVDGVRKVIGECVVKADGTFTATVGDHAGAQIVEFLQRDDSSFSIASSFSNREPDEPLPFRLPQGDYLKGKFPSSEKYYEHIDPLYDMGYKSNKFIMSSRLSHKEIPLEKADANQVVSGIIKATGLVQDYINNAAGETKVLGGDIFVVWFCKTLQNWKALVGTNLKDEMYYEVTYNGDKKETYIDAYKKVENVCIKDPDEEDTDVTDPTQTLESLKAQFDSLQNNSE